MIYLGIESQFTPITSGPAHCKKCGGVTEQVLLVADKKAKLEFFITVGKWQSCYLVCIPCSKKPKKWGQTAKNHAACLRKHISKDDAQSFVATAIAAAGVAKQEATA